MTPGQYTSFPFSKRSRGMRVLPSLGSVRDAYDNGVRQIRELAKIIVAPVAESDSQ